MNLGHIPIYSRRRAVKHEEQEVIVELAMADDAFKRRLENFESAHRPAEAVDTK